MCLLFCLCCLFCQGKGTRLFSPLDLCVSSLRRGHANLLCIVPISTDDPRRESSGRMSQGGLPEACGLRSRAHIFSFFLLPAAVRCDADGPRRESGDTSVFHASRAAHLREVTRQLPCTGFTIISTIYISNID